MDSADWEQYLSIAYEDVKLAFEYYLEHCNNGRPIVLAGLSQGADLSIRLVKDYFADEKAKDLLVACYAIGWRITEAEVSQGKSDVGVIVSFNSEAEYVTDAICRRTYR